ncbi:methanogen output domain 1-containing protein [Candidatus Methylospira mobilis]|uniref:methanogen output domain 1-containing protein n=1 Tax=Candidatus Methylospira mobilis TaxID=1808979 RepID=UPI0028EA45F6|nr:methanogen output domain 1-containing protein [Candidatus Methylospira mobilis]WNV03270.1 methanogen output domain 1-containing protein [Candidatus Methylospira mobilis]
MSNDAENIAEQMAALKIPLDRDLFMRTLIRELADVLQDVVGAEQASSFISVVGQLMGKQINEQYCKALDATSLSREQVAAVLVDLKKRIGGDFFIVAQDDEKIIFGSRSCPFEEKVVGQKAMCMMTSNVFGSIAAANLGYAKVHLQATLAEGQPECRVVVFLKMSDEADAVEGREYFKSAAG